MSPLRRSALVKRVRDIIKSTAGEDLDPTYPPKPSPKYRLPAVFGGNEVTKTPRGQTLNQIVQFMVRKLGLDPVDTRQKVQFILNDGIRRYEIVCNNNHYTLADFASSDDGSDDNFYEIPHSSDENAKQGSGSSDSSEDDNAGVSTNQPCTSNTARRSDRLRNRGKRKDVSSSTSSTSSGSDRTRRPKVLTKRAGNCRCLVGDKRCSGDGEHRKKRRPRRQSVRIREQRNSRCHKNKHGCKTSSCRRHCVKEHVECSSHKVCSNKSPFFSHQTGNKRHCTNHLCHNTPPDHRATAGTQAHGTCQLNHLSSSNKASEVAVLRSASSVPTGRRRLLHVSGQSQSLQSCVASSFRDDGIIRAAEVDTKRKHPSNMYHRHTKNTSRNLCKRESAAVVVGNVKKHAQDCSSCSSRLRVSRRSHPHVCTGREQDSGCEECELEGCSSVIQIQRDLIAKRRSTPETKYVYNLRSNKNMLESTVNS